VITADGSTATSAVAGNGYFIDTTSAAHTINLPGSPSAGDTIAIKDYAGTFGTNNLTIGRNGNNIQGVANDSLISTNRASLTLVYVDATKGWLYAVESNVADLTTYIVATGGTVTTSGDFKIHTFTGDGCFTVTQSGSGDIGNTVDYLVVAGGGGANGRHSGGGGAGGYRESHSTPISGCYTASPLANPTGITIATTSYPVIVGAGGSGAPDPGGFPALSTSTSGNNSSFSTITSAGGGRGVTYNVSQNNAGGSGGGGGFPGGAGGSGNTPPVSPPQGSTGGPSDASGPQYGGGGGGGAIAVGVAGSPSSGGNGGAGTTTSISSSPTAYAGGGGGGGYSGVSGTGGTGGGGAGGNPGTAGSNNTGGGGGGGASGGDGANGGKGIVIIRYKYQ